nr:NAD(P)/FAD-dependent oxidoreductase [Herbiconiux sp. SYSU D00978]
MTENEARYDVVVIGGGAAGLSGALMLARARRSVLVVDAGTPRNAPAEAVHGLFARDGVPPAELLATGRGEVRRYGGAVIDGRVVEVSRDDGGLRVELEGGHAIGARRLLVASGVVDALPDVAGLRERWGRDVVHCPYCHGWEVRDRRIGVLATGPRAMHQVQLFRQWSDDVVLLLNDAMEPSGQEAEELAARGIEVVAGAVASVEVRGDALTGVRLADGRLVDLGALAVATRTDARAEFLAPLGLEPAPHPSGMGSTIAADAFGRTAAPGVWVAGNAADMSAQVGGAAAAGAMAAAQINMDLVTEEIASAVTARRDTAVPAGS